jgi:hypothetical protein
LVIALRAVELCLLNADLVDLYGGKDLFEIEQQVRKARAQELVLLGNRRCGHDNPAVQEIDLGPSVEMASGASTL